MIVWRQISDKHSYTIHKQRMEWIWNQNPNVETFHVIWSCVLQTLPVYNYSYRTKKMHSITQSMTSLQQIGFEFDVSHSENVTTCFYRILMNHNKMILIIDNLLDSLFLVMFSLKINYLKIDTNCKNQQRI